MNVIDNFEEQIKNRLKSIRVYLKQDGGDVELIEIINKTVKLKLIGACGSCPHATTTLKEVIENDLKNNVDPDIEVIKG